MRSLIPGGPVRRHGWLGTFALVELSRCGVFALIKEGNSRMEWVYASDLKVASEHEPERPPSVWS